MILHDVAVKPVPLDPYVTTGAPSDAGPKFVPPKINCTDGLDVGIVCNRLLSDACVTLVIAGVVYDTVSDDDALV